jgi:hypothetical protein
LNPKIKHSGQSARVGHISKAGPDTLRWAVIEAAQQAWRPTNPWHELYSDIKRRHGKPNPAKAAVARKILIASWHILSRKEPFKPSAPRDQRCPGKLHHSSGRLRPKNDLRSRGSCNRPHAANERRKRCQQPAEHQPPRRSPPLAPDRLTTRRPSKRDEWLVGRGYLSAESIALCLAEPQKSDIREIKEETGELQAA